MTRKKISAFLPVLALLASGATLAQEPSQQPSRPAQAAHLFGGVEPMANDQLQVEDLLRAGKWKDAKILAQRQFLVAAGYIDQYPGVVAVALALDALADAGLGHEGPAICRWNLAQSLDPNLARADLSAFAAAGELLAKRSDKAPKTREPEPLKLPTPDPLKKPENAEVQRPELLSHSSPQYTPAARRAKAEGKVVVEGIIEKDGSLSRVRALRKQPLGLDLSAMEAVCGWRFKPATLKGEPVKVYYVLTVNFSVQKGLPPPISEP
ncbi:MAG TPA: TonB family protein [Thermoanaerobaculia bacterium]|nr:TonB family protein [Thermoanaerobaculia bacterium]